MTKKDLVQKYMQAKGYKVIAGELSDNLEAFLPVLLMDLEYSLFKKDIAGAEPWRHELKQLLNQWRAAYNKFNGRFFRTLSEDEQGEVVGYMDDFEDYMHNDIVRLMLATLEVVPDRVGLAARKIIASSYVCFVLTVIARTSSHKLYYQSTPARRLGAQSVGPQYKPEPTPELDAIALKSAQFCTVYANRLGIAQEIHRNEKITALTDSICRHAVQWLTV